MSEQDYNEEKRAAAALYVMGLEEHSMADRRRAELRIAACERQVNELAEIKEELLKALKYLKHHGLLINSHAHAVTDAAIAKAEQK